MAMTNMELSTAVRELQQHQQAMQRQYNEMQTENVMQANNIRANSGQIDGIRAELLSLENKLNDTVEPALAKLGETMQTLQSTLDHLGPLSAQVDQLTANWKKMSEDMQAQVAPIVSADIVTKITAIEQTIVGHQTTKQ